MAEKKEAASVTMWRIAREITEKMEAGQMPDPNQLAAYAIAISVLATDVEKLETNRSAIVKRVSAEPLPEFPPGEDPGVVARTVRNIDLRAIADNEK